MINNARNFEGVFLNLVNGNHEFKAFYAFSFGDDPYFEAEKIAQNIFLDVIKCLVEQGFLMTSDNKDFLGRIL